MSKTETQKLLIFALGGVGEIGKNMYVIQYGEDIVVVDSGLKFPEEDMLGIDLVVPDVSYLIERKDQVQGILLTHGHEDHIGGLPYVLKQLNVPIYGTKLTLGLVEMKLKEENLLGITKRNLINADSKLKLGTITASFFRTNHSIPDSLGVALETPEGVVVHTGDFKFDQTPVNEQYADLHRMAEIGKKGVLALLSDSTNSERPGYTGSERTVGVEIEEVFRKAQQRVIIATFASNIHRIQQVMDAAMSTNRKVVVVGRSMVNVVSIANELGYLNIPEGMLIEPEEINKYAADRIAVLSTGSQGEPMSALTRMARATHRKVEILPGDTVIIAATPIPGNERYVGRTVDELFRIGAHVIYGPSSITGVHVSGHGSQEELKLMLNIMRPKYFIPIHGEYRMLRQHGILAEAVGVAKEDIFIVENGESIEILNGIATRGAKIQSGNILIDGLGIGDVGNIVLRDRKLLSQDGILVVVVTISRQDSKILSGPDIISRGFVYVRESEGLMDEANRIVVSTLTRLMNENINEWTSLKNNVKEVLGRFLYDQTRRRPMILPIIMEV